MVTTLPHPHAGRHRTDQPRGARAPHRRGRGRHVAAPDHARRRRIIGLGAVTVATVAVLPVMTSPPLADVTSEAWERLSGSPGDGSRPEPGADAAGSVEPPPGTGAHRGEDPGPELAPPASTSTAPPTPTAAPTAPGPSAEPPATEAPPSPEAPPPSEAPAPAPPPEPELTATYRVVWGDTLTSIAAEHGMTWQQVHEANADAIGPNPNLVIVGTVLRVLPA